MFVDGKDHEDYYESNIIHVDTSSSGFLKRMEEKLWEHESHHYKGLQGRIVSLDELKNAFPADDVFNEITLGSFMSNHNMDYETLSEILSRYTHRLKVNGENMDWFRKGYLNKDSRNLSDLYEIIFPKGMQTHIRPLREKPSHWMDYVNVAYTDKGCGSTIVGMPVLEEAEFRDKGVLFYNCGACERTMYASQKEKLVETPGPF